MDDEALYEQYDEASVYEEGDENTLAYTVSIEERQQQPADNMVVQAMPADIQQTKFRLDTGCVGGNVVKDEALLRDVDAANVSVTGVAGPADQTSLKGTLARSGHVLCARESARQPHRRQEPDQARAYIRGRQQ